VVHKVVVIFLLAGACSGASRGPVAPAPAPAPTLVVRAHEAQTARLAQRFIDGQWVASMAIGLLVGDRAEVYGYGRVHDGKDGPPDGDTLYEIGSASKVFTSLLLADMTVRGQVALDEPVARLLPAAVTAPEGGVGSLTLAQLATHTSGLPRMPENFHPRDAANPYADYSAADLDAFVARYQLARPPGTYEYSNLGAGLLGHLLAGRAGMPYEALLAQRIARPLRMASTVVSVPASLRARFADGHTGDGEATGPWDLDALVGAGGIRSTVNDMLRFVRANLDPERAPADLRGALRMTHQPRADRPGGRVALGWHVGLDGAHPGILWHNGETGGFHSFVAFDPERKLGVVVLAGSAQMAIDKLGAALLAMLRGEPAALDLPELVPVDPAILDRYAGEYEVIPTFHLIIRHRDDRLTVQATGQGEFRIYPGSDTEYYLRAVDARISFHVGPDGRADSLTLYQGGKTIPAKRVR
jgi:serine-type D-Ala-D-Ala carboxypeptidase/endopeptidase